MNRARKAWWAVVLMVFFALGQKNYGSYTIWRRVNEEKFWANPVEWHPNTSIGHPGWKNDFNEYKEHVNDDLARLGVHPEEVAYYVCDVFSLLDKENIFLDFPPDLTLSTIFAAKSYHEGKSIFAYPYDTEKEGNYRRVASLPGGFFKRHYDLQNDAEHEYRKLNITGHDGFFGGSGFVVLAFFPVHGGHRDGQIVLVRYRIWEPGSPEELCIQAIDPDLKIGKRYRVKEEDICAAITIDRPLIFIECSEDKVQIKVFDKGNPDCSTLYDFRFILSGSRKYLSPECLSQLRKLSDFYKKNPDIFIFLRDGDKFQRVHISKGKYITTALTLFSVIDPSLSLDGSAPSRRPILESIIDFFAINKHKNQLTIWGGIASSLVNGEVLPYDERMRSVYSLAGKALSLTPKEVRDANEDRFLGSRQLEESDYAYLVKAIEQSLMIVEEYESKLCVKIFDFHNNGELSSFTEVPKDSPLEQVTFQPIADFYRENPDTVVLYQNVAGLYEDDFINLYRSYRGGPPPWDFYAVKDQRR